MRSEGFSACVVCVCVCVCVYIRVSVGLSTVFLGNRDSSERETGTYYQVGGMDGKTSGSGSDPTWHLPAMWAA